MSQSSSARRHLALRLRIVALLGSLALLVSLSGNSGTGMAHTLADSGNAQSPEATCPAGGQCFADVTSGNPFYAFANSIYMADIVSGYACGGTNEPCDDQNRPYYRPGAGVTRGQMAKFVDNARRMPGIHIAGTGGTPPIFVSETSGQALQAVSQSNNAIYAQTGNSTAIYAQAAGNLSIGVKGVGTTGVSGTGAAGSYGVYGTAPSDGTGVGGFSTNSGPGVYGSSAAGKGVYGVSTSGTGVWGEGTYGSYFAGTTGAGVQGVSVSGAGVRGSSTSGLAGLFVGSVQVTGSLSKGAGSFKIDDPLDPANRYLYHSFVESPDMMNIYNGNVVLDPRGEATIQLPDWFGALNKDFRYQLTAIGAPGPNLYVSSKVQDNRFSIAGGTPGMEVSWQVTGIRQDPYANAHRIPVEEDKPVQERGKYLHPTEWGQPMSLAIEQEELPQTPQATTTSP